MTLAVDQITDEAGTGAVSLYLAQTLKGTLILDGNTPEVTASLNHSSLVDRAVGDFASNHANVFADTLYGMLGSVTDGSAIVFWPNDTNYPRTAAQNSFNALSKGISVGWSSVDPDRLDEALFGDLA